MQHARFAEYFQEQYPIWCRFVASLLHTSPDDPDVQGIVQEGVTNLMFRGGGIAAIDERQPAPLFFASIRNAIRDSKRREKHHRKYLEQQTLENVDRVDAREMEATDDELLVLREAVRDALREAVASLTLAELQAVLLWLKSEGRGQALEQLGATTSEDIRNRYDQPLHRAKRKIREHLGALYQRAALLGSEDVLLLLLETAELAAEEAQMS